MYNSDIKAQEVHFVEIGINGLHCSACTFSVERSLKKLDFVSVIQMDLNKRSGKVFFKSDGSINYKLLSKAVIDAGFSVRSFDVVFRTPLIADEHCFGKDFCILNKEVGPGDRIRLLGKNFQEKKAVKESEALLNQDCKGCPDASQRLKVVLI